MNKLINEYYYTNDMEILKKSGCRIHIHGHSHTYLDYKKEGIGILCNPFGYPNEEIFTTVKTLKF